MDILNEKITGIEISISGQSKRIINLQIKKEALDKLIFPFKKFDITALEYKPFARFTLAKSLDELFSNKLSKLIHSILTYRNMGCLLVVPEVVNKKFNDVFLVKLATGLAHLIGIPNFDHMSSKYYARFFVKHEDQSDSYLRKAYTNMDLHTDGTYVTQKTDWLLMTKLEEKNAKGWESVFLHLDDWEHCEELFNDPIGKKNFTWNSPKSKNVDYKVEHPVFFKDSEGRPQISYIDQFPEPQSMEQGNFLQKLSDALEESKKKITIPLPVGSTVFANNFFWLHGRKVFKENKNLSRELLRIRGSFFAN